MFTLFGKKQSRPDDVLPAGWQFYARPTNLEPPGTVFRIDNEARRYIVERLKPVIERSAEPGAAKTERIETKAAVIARLLGIESLGMKAGVNRAKAFQYQISEPVRESTSDVEIDKVLKPFLETMDFRKGNRYFIVREARSATAMTFVLSDEEAGGIAAKASDAAVAAASLTVKATSQKTSEVTQAFPERLGVMFLAEEIAPVASGLGGQEATLGRVPVPAPLDWVDPEYAVVRVLFGTDRSPAGSDGEKQRFGSDRSELRYGACEVSIPRDHRMGDLEAPSILKLEFRADPAKHVVVLRANTEPREKFMAELAARLAASASKSAFLFVHGYNVSFEDAARRTAQMAYDLGFDGAPLFYSWPSRAGLAAYTVDEANVEWAQSNLKAFLADLLEHSGVRSLYLIAHSMGNRALVHAVVSLLADKPALKPKLTELILTAPDIDAAVFKRDIAPALVKGGCSTTLYASSEDLALLASKKVHGYARAGDSGRGLVVLGGIETIDATAVDTSLVGHSYFAESRSVLSDIFYILRNGHRAEQRFGLRRVDTEAGRYWTFKS